MIECDYTKAANQDTMKGGALQAYRLLHWLADILKNWFSDPINIKDERLCRLLDIQDNPDLQRLNSMFDIGTPYSQQTTKACTTPMILVSLVDTQYPINSVTNMGAGAISLNGAIPMYKGIKHRVINCTVSTITQSYDGTLLLSGLIQDFMVINADQLVRDNGMISSFRVTGSAAPQEIKQGTTAHAKTVYQAKIGIQIIGGISWTTDTQGPVFRGITSKLELS